MCVRVYDVRLRACVGSSMCTNAYTHGHELEKKNICTKEVKYVYARTLKMK